MMLPQPDKQTEFDSPKEDRADVSKASTAWGLRNWLLTWNSGGRIGRHHSVTKALCPKMAALEANQTVWVLTLTAASRYRRKLMNFSGPRIFHHANWNNNSPWRERCYEAQMN